MIQHGLLRKEWLESVRTYRILILPLVLLLLGIAQPIVYHFMPVILDQAGLPEGMVLEMPPISSVDVIAAVFDQYNQIGLLVVVLVSMGLIGREIETGIAGFLRSLGVSRLAYFASKWLWLVLTVVGSVILGTLGAAYYTGLLFEPLSFGDVLGAALIYSLQFVFVLTLTLALNTVLVAPLASAGAAIGISIAASVIGAVSKTAAPWLPLYASHMAKALLMGTGEVMLIRLLVPVLWTALLFWMGYIGLRKREL